MKPPVARIPPRPPNRGETDRWRQAIPASAAEPATKAVASVAKILPSVSPKSPLRIAAIATSAATQTSVAAPSRKIRRSDIVLHRLGLVLLHGSASVLPDECLRRVVGVVVRHLRRRGLHQVRARALERAGDP